MRLYPVLLNALRVGLGLPRTFIWMWRLALSDRARAVRPRLSRFFLIALLLLTLVPSFAVDRMSIMLACLYLMSAGRS